MVVGFMEIGHSTNSVIVIRIRAIYRFEVRHLSANEGAFLANKGTFNNKIEPVFIALIGAFAANLSAIRTAFV